MPVEILVHLLMLLDCKSLTIMKSVASSSAIWKHLFQKELGIAEPKFNRIHWKNEFVVRYAEKLSQEQRDRAVRERWFGRPIIFPHSITPPRGVEYSKKWWRSISGL